MSIWRLFLCGLMAIATIPSVARQKAKYLEPGTPAEDRIDDLLRRMTVDEKGSQIVDSWGSAGVQRMKIPAVLKTESLHSQSYSTGATLFPQPIAMAATFDPDLIQRVGRQTAMEAKAAHLRASWSPVLDVVRDVRWQRPEMSEAPLSRDARAQCGWAASTDSESLSLQPGEKEKVALSHHFAIGGLHRVQIGDQPERVVMIPGGVNLALRNPLVGLKLNEGKGTGARNERLFLGFHGRDILGNRDVPTGTWVNVTYAYDATLQKAFLYLNGSLDKTGNQGSYTGPVETIGDAPALQHGRCAMDDVVVTQDCLSPGLVALLFHDGYDALLYGGYTSTWRPYEHGFQSLEAVTEMPTGQQALVDCGNWGQGGKRAELANG